MGGNSSREEGGRRSRSGSSSYGSAGGGYAQDPPPWATPSHGHRGYPQQPVYQSHNSRDGGYSHPRRDSYTPPQTPRAAPPSNARRRLERRYSRIADEYNSLEEVTEALARAGLESSNLIVALTSLRATRRNSFNRQCLHSIGDVQNPYEQAISIIGRTLSAFDEDNLIPCFGFGDATTHDQDVFSFFPDERPCNGFEEVLSRYREIAPRLRLAGPTSFAPIVEMAMTIVEQSGGQYHVLLIIADGQVTRSVDILDGQLSMQEQKTVDAIVRASGLPLSIVLVGVGDGPWDMMREFDDNIPSRTFDNFQFVNFTEIMSKRIPQLKKDAEFALSALMEIPSQYKATLEMGFLGQSTGQAPDRVPLPPPSMVAGFGGSKTSSRSSSFQLRAAPPATPPPTSSSPWETNLCPICLASQKNLAFQCGHQTCCDCGENLYSCPICREDIHTRIRLY
ncbi:unnamed protein product [Spirodela intermedia]|uniref:RING-type domain-containing protein n=1 Tax=Spirodela intermedia TaxID=51605 RepID=A0A7I8JD38_SPIIN|nr:unnamed protein product [Spirodela intermedia]CAA6668019.1 unnamed protein product [Spirodela intermedia]